MKKFPVTAVIIMAMVLSVMPVSAYAIDNPDAPDYISGFNARSARYESKINEQAGKTTALIDLYADYDRFLDRELNQAYNNLIKQLSGPEKQEIITSQKKWLLFRDAEYSFIADNWTREKFGSSYVLSRDGYRAQITKDRIVSLLNYLQNYP